MKGFGGRGFTKYFIGLFLCDDSLENQLEKGCAPATILLRGRYAVFIEPHDSQLGHKPLLYPASDFGGQILSLDNQRNLSWLWMSAIPALHPRTLEGEDECGTVFYLPDACACVCVLVGRDELVLLRVLVVELFAFCQSFQRLVRGRCVTYPSRILCDSGKQGWIVRP